MKKKIAEDVKIYKTKDLSQFNFIKGNREINQKKVLNIIGSIQEGVDYLKYNPILVDKTMAIIDGQHRFDVCRRLEREVYYIVVPAFGISSVSTLNTNTSNWTNREFLNWYMKRGVEIYKKIDWFCDTFKLNINNAIDLLEGGAFSCGATARRKAGIKFKEGRCELKYLDRGIDLGEDINAMRPYFSSFDRNVLRAIEKLSKVEDFDVDFFVRKANIYGRKIEKQINAQKYILEIEAVYNWKSKIVTRLI
jgi:hypothetical protein